MQKLNLTEKLFDELQNRKTITIRLRKREISLGPLLFESNDKSRATVVKVTKVYYSKLKDVALLDLINDGFKNHNELLKQLKLFYPAIEMESWVTVVGFVVSKKLLN